MKLTPILPEPSTITLAVPNQATFKQLIDLTELPECILEVAETRELVDSYLDTEGEQLAVRGSALRLATVGSHHFLIFDQRRASGLLAVETEYVEHLTPTEHAAQLAGDRTHALYATVAASAPGVLESQLVRRSTFQSKLFRVGETRFELGLEAVVYERAGASIGDQLVQLELIEGAPAVLEAIGEYLIAEYQLVSVIEPPFRRGQRLLKASATLCP